MKHVDFVLCGAEPLTVLGVIELDDRSHATLGAGVKDDLKDAALRSANIPILRVTARRTYSVQELRTSLQNSFKLPVSE